MQTLTVLLFYFCAVNKKNETKAGKAIAGYL
jgi:hypothetical protein